jgi:hypothetical protein
MKDIWIVIKSTSIYCDWTHEYEVVYEEPKHDDDEENDDDVLHYKIDDECKEFYLVFRFFENMVDINALYTNKSEATVDFYKNTNDQEKNIYNEDYCQVIEKQYNGDLTSTIYYAEKYKNHYEWPDKSNRWILETFILNSS